MLRRAKRLRNSFDRYCAESGAQHLTRNSDEWRKIDYLLSLTQPFYYYTTCLSKTKETTIHSAFAIYNLLFDHLEKSIAQLARKKAKWKITMLSALKHAKQKLSDSYAATNEVFGDLYAIATIIAPQYKLQFFSGKNWCEIPYAVSQKHREILPAISTAISGSTGCTACIACSVLSCARL